MMRLRILLLLIGIGTASAQMAGTVTITPITMPPLPLGVVTLPSGKAVNLAVAAGAGLFATSLDPDRRVWSVSDRGPTIDCLNEQPERTFCPAGLRGRLFLLPGYSPAIYGMEVYGKVGRYTEMITLRGASGRPLSGLPLPQPQEREGLALGSDGQRLEPDLSGIDPGGLVRLKDGSFLIADGYGPSLVEVSREGIVRRRLVPEDRASAFQTADFPVEPSLSAELSHKGKGRVLAGLALTPDERAVFLALQFPQDNTQAALIVKIDRSTGKTLAEWSYPLTTNTTADPSSRHETRLMELAALDDNRLLVLESTRNLSHIYRISLPKAPAYDDAKGAPLAKSLLYASDPQASPGRLTGMTLLSEKEMLLSGTAQSAEGGRTHLYRLTFPRSLTN